MQFRATLSIKVIIESTILHIYNENIENIYLIDQFINCTFAYIIKTTQRVKEKTNHSQRKTLYGV